MVVGYYFIDDENFNILPSEFVKINDLSEYKNDKPLIVIGYLNNKDKYNIDIDESKIDDNLFWTFSISEYKDRFNSDIFFFKEYCYKLFFDEIEYKFFNLFEKKYSDIKKLIIFLKNNKIYITENMIYFTHKKTVIGIDLNQVDSFFCSKKKILNKIKKDFNFFEINEDIKTKYNGFIEFNNSNYIISYLLSLQ